VVCTDCGFCRRSYASVKMKIVNATRRPALMNAARMPARW
jgi:hypothetical protein